MKLNFEERKIEETTIDNLSWGDTFILAHEVDEDIPTVFMLIEPDYDLSRENGEEYAIDVETGELLKFSPGIKVIYVHGELTIRKP